MPSALRTYKPVAPHAANCLVSKRLALGAVSHRRIHENAYGAGKLKLEIRHSSRAPPFSRHQPLYVAVRRISACAGLRPGTRERPRVGWPIVGIPRIEINGGPATVDQLAYPAIANYGHFTAMQVRGGAVRGLALHLARLDSATRELFGTGQDGDLVRAYIRHALGAGIPDASVRISVFQQDGDERPSIMVVVRPPASPPTVPQRLTAVPYERPVAHIKHVGTFGQIYHGQAAERAGFDDALLTGPGGVIAEGTITNIGFFDGDAVIWPDAPSLAGITMQLVARTLAERGMPSRHDTVRIADLPSFRSAFVANSLGVAPVGQVDDQILPIDPEFTQNLTEAYESVPWDRI